MTDEQVRQATLKALRKCIEDLRRDLKAQLLRAERREGVTWRG
jgi:hypothetical protein